MGNDPKLLSEQECADEVRLMARRMALLFSYFATTLIEELGEVEGKRLIEKSVQRSGEHCGRVIREAVIERGLPLSEGNFNLIRDLPHYGWEIDAVQFASGETHTMVRYCPIAATFLEMGPEAQKLGRLYCFIDQAKQNAYNPDEEYLHLKNILDGDPYCEFLIKPRQPQKNG